MRKKFGIGCLVVIALLVGLVIVGAIIGPQSSGSSSGGGGGGGSSPTSVPAATTLLNITGSGTKTTEKFTPSGDDWDLGWSYDCSKFYGGKGNFQVYVYNGDGSMSTDTGVNELGSGGHSTEHFHTGGQKYLVVNSECSWHIKATG